jgi:pimeloyl-ACP methyl ester carboxylesterase
MPSFDSSGVRIHYVAEGNGPPVVLVHGLTSSIDRNWRLPGIIDALLGAGRRVVALDCRGHGESEKPHEASAYGGTAIGDDIVALMDHLGIDVADLVAGRTRRTRERHGRRTTVPRVRAGESAVRRLAAQRTGCP